ncbi:hypothetical protein MMC28_011544, partial [Mycoblastus sanguinarius]|nr:hypothetical protein [Mycoblastus sanguinarius]
MDINDVSFRPVSEMPHFYHHFYTLYLFTASDFKTILLPETAFGVFSCLSGSLLLTDGLSRALPILLRIPLVLLWIWVNLLPFNISNQRQQSAVLEDGANKPWRPIPSGRISLPNAKWLMWACYSVALIVSINLDCAVPCLTLIALGWIYNDLGGADYSCLVRNFINAAGFTCFASGATVVASGRVMLTCAAYKWFAMIVAIVFSTVQMQDMPDQEGDSVRGRKTVPLVIGDREARWTVAAPVAFWSVLAPAFWKVSFVGFGIPLLLGIVVTKRVMVNCTVREDKLTFKLWNLWMVSL